jgi:hypothetical protein
MIRYYKRFAHLLRSTIICKYIHAYERNQKPQQKVGIILKKRMKPVGFWIRSNFLMYVPFNFHE